MATEHVGYRTSVNDGSVANGSNRSREAVLNVHQLVRELFMTFMTKIELKALRRTLENIQAELGNESRNRAALAIETTPEDLDRIQHASDRDWAMSNLERNSNRLREVQAALRRIDTGTFGICVGCEENIHPKRLSAVPWASSCIGCQEAAEREQKAPWNEIETPNVMAA
jgi:DnaK suppressor protein